MCGILGIVAGGGERPGVELPVFLGMRDLMANRGPDAVGQVAHENVLFGHRLLAVIDPGHGAQPMWSDDRRYLLVYNGELYNDAEVREELRAADPGLRFDSNCDTETVLRAFAAWGDDCVKRLRGMFGFGIYDFKEECLTLARDPLGIKPVYFSSVGEEFLFASHLPSILAHPELAVQPNMAAVSAYMTTLRTTTGHQTLFEGVYTLRPGEMARIDFGKGAEGAMKIETYWDDRGAGKVDGRSFKETAKALRAAVTDSVSRHLRSDVPICILLSGGLDSAIIGTVAKEIGATQALRTWCAGDEDDVGEDRKYAKLMAEVLHADHHDVVVDRLQFHQHWQLLVEETGLPLSTPNETAIHAVALALKEHATVALSGEGADELFGGYALPLLSGIDQLRVGGGREGWPGGPAGEMRYLAELEAQYGTTELGTGAEHYFRCNSWIHPASKSNVFKEGDFEAVESDALLLNEIIGQFEEGEGGEDGGTAERLLRIQRRVNLTGLLRRLDTAMMAAQVEGRTPFADVRMAELAGTIPFDYKIKIEAPEDGGWSSAAVTVGEKRVITKAILREAFGADIPEEILNRPKASFPLPFQSWIVDAGSTIRNSAFLQELIQDEVLLVVGEDPATHWQMAWPLANLAIWAKRWWG